MINEGRPTSGSSIFIYTAEDGDTRIECKFENETIWLTQKLIAELYDKDIRTVSEHLKNIFEDGELDPNSVIRKFRITAVDAKTYETQHYNLDAILAVGYRIKSPRGTQFRQWATARLSEYLVKGFTMDDERLRNPPGPGIPDYFEELLARIRDIRASERRFYQKVLDIYATSTDYTPQSEIAQQFFATVQNKMHVAAHGHTAAEVIHLRADATKPMMGLTSTKNNGVVHKGDISVAKNYLSEDEIGILNRIVTMYLDYAELQAIGKKPMRMIDWLVKLDEFLQFNGREVLANAGTISHEVAVAKAEHEYDRYRKVQDALPQKVDVDFEQAAKRLESTAKGKKSGNNAKQRKR